MTITETTIATINANDPITAADVVSALTAADGSAAALAAAHLNDSDRFTAAAFATAAYLTSGIKGHSIRALIAAGASATSYRSPASIKALRQTGEILALGGMIHDADGNPIPRAIMACYSGGNSAGNVTASQHAEVLSKAEDVPEAYLLLSRFVAANLKDAKAAAKAVATESETETETKAADKGPADRLAGALATIDALIASREGLRDAEMPTAALILDKLAALTVAFESADDNLADMRAAAAA